MATCSLLVLDFDGVVLDSARVKAAAFSELFAEHPEHAAAIAELHHQMTGKSRFLQFEAVYRDLLGADLAAAESAALGERYSDLFRDRVRDCPAVPGAIEFLEAHGAAHAIWLASGSPHDELLATLEHRDLLRHFTGVAGTPASKADTVRRGLLAHGCAPNEAVFVGDARADREAALATGLRFVGVVQAGDPDPFPPGTSTIVDLHPLDRLLGWSGGLDPEGGDPG